MRINGWILFAGIIMVVAGCMTAINGLVAIIHDEVYVVTDDQVVAFDFTMWGWIHLILGAVMVFAAFSLLQGATWARIVTAVLAGLSAISQIAFISAYPFWALAIIGIDIAVIYAVCTMGRPDEEVEIGM